MKHLAFTGTKQGMSIRQHETACSLLKEYRDKGYLFMHNGDCVGADAQAAQIWNKLKGRVILHPPTKEDYRAYTPNYLSFEPRPYLHRDQHMVEMSKVLIATPLTRLEERRSGTWTTVRYARKLRRKIWIIEPDGTLRLDI